jgi:hypothetical protein
MKMIPLGMQRHDIIMHIVCLICHIYRYNPAGVFSSFLYKTFSLAEVKSCMSAMVSSGESMGLRPW